MSAELYKEAVMGNVFFPTVRGMVTVQDVAQMQLKRKDNFDLDTLAKSLHESLQQSEEVSFIETKPTGDAILQLKMDIVKDIIATRLAEKNEAKLAQEARAHNAKIDSLIAEKQDQNLKSLDIEDLQKLRK